MCRITHNIYLCGHDDTEPLSSCTTWRRFRGSRKALGTNRRLPNHETTSIDRRHNRVCNLCRAEGRRPNPVYVRAALNPQAPAPPPRTPSPILDEQQRLVPYEPPPLLQGFPNAIPRPQPLNPLVPEVPARPLAPQFPAGRELLLYRGINSLPRVRGPNGLVYVATPEGFAPLDTFVAAFSDILFRMEPHY